MGGYNQALPALQVDTTGNFLRGAQGIASLRDAGLQRQLTQQHLQLNQDEIMKQNQARQDDADIRSGYEASMKQGPDGQMTVDRPTLLSTIGKSNPRVAAQLGVTLTAQDTAASEAAAKLQKTQLDAAAAHVDGIDKILQGVNDQATYSNALQHAQSLGITKPGELPEQYDPQLVQRLHANALSQKDALAAKQQQMDAEEKAKHDRALEQHNVATVPLANRATEIYAIPKKQRTAEQNAFITGYEKNNDVTRIQPAQVRVQALMQMPQAIADPNDPSREVYTTRAGAVGQEAPGSGPAAAARRMDTFMTSGKGGQALVAFNTAQTHLQLLGQAVEALHNGNSTLLNSVANSYAKATGTAAPTNFDAVKNALKGEVAKALTGNATVSEQAELDKDFNNASSPAQLAGIAQKYTQLMQGKKDALHKQYNDTKKGTVDFGGQGTASPAATHRFNPTTGKIEAIQ